MKLVLVAFLVSVHASTCFAANSYTLTEIQTGGSPFASGVAITDSNLILTGTALASNSDPTPTSPSAAIWNSGGYLQPLSDVPNGQSGALAINSSGVAVGFSFDLDSGIAAAVQWQKGVPSVLPQLGNDQAAKAYSINDFGEIVGSSWSAGFGATTSRAVLWNGGVAQDISTQLPIEYSQSAGVAINNSGQILVQASTDSYIISGNTVQQISSTTANTGIYGQAMNGLGEVAGTIYTGSGQGQAFLWANDKMVIAPSFSDTFPFEDAPTAINDEGVVAGFYISSTGERAFVWDGSDGIVDLNTLIAPDSGWVLSIAWGIDDNGDIVGMGYHDGEQQGFILTPNAASSNTATPEPASVSLLLLGTTLLLHRKRRIDRI